MRKFLIIILFPLFFSCTTTYEIVYKTPTQISVSRIGYLYDMIDSKGKEVQFISFIDTIEYNVGQQFIVKNDSIIRKK